MGEPYVLKLVLVAPLALKCQYPCALLTASTPGTR